MSKANILVNIRDNAKKAQKRIKKNLKKVDKTKMRPKLNIKENIKSTETKLQALGRTRTVKYKTKVNKRDAIKRLITDGGVNHMAEMEKMSDEIRKKVDKTKMRPTLNIKDNIETTAAKLESLQGTRYVKYKTLVDKKSMAKTKAQMEAMPDGGRKGGFGKRSDFQSFGGFTPSVSGRGESKHGKRILKEAEIKKLNIDQMGISTDDFDLDKTTGQLRNSKGRFGRKPSGKHGRGLVSKGKRPGSTMVPTDGVTGSIREQIAKQREQGGPNRLQHSILGQNFTNPFNEQKVKNIKDRTKSFIKTKKEATASVDKFDISLGQMGDQLKHVGNNFRKYSPNIMMWWKLVALLLPMVIALAVQFAGVAVAIGAVVGAGAAMMGLGLVGHGEALADSFALAERQMNKLKRELFQTFKPALQEFAPISGEFMAKLPQRVEPLVQPLRDLTIFEDTFISLFNNLVGWTGEVVGTLVSYADELDQVAHRFGGILGSGILNFLEWIIETSYEQQDVMIEVMGVFKSVVGSVWQLLQAVSILMAMLSPLFNIFHSIMKLLNNKWGSALVVVIASLYLLIGVATSAAKSLMFLKLMALMTGQSMGGVLLSGLKKAISGLTAYIGTTWAAVSATRALATAIAGLGAGWLIMQGMSHLVSGVTNSAEGIEDSRRRTGGGGGSSGSTVINNEYNIHGKDAEEAARKMDDRDHKETHNRWGAQGM